MPNLFRHLYGKQKPFLPERACFSDNGITIFYYEIINTCGHFGKEKQDDKYNRVQDRIGLLFRREDTPKHQKDWIPGQARNDKAWAGACPCGSRGRGRDCFTPFAMTSKNFSLTCQKTKPPFQKERA